VVKPSVLVVGFATRHVAQSASRAGYTVYAIDHFCDQDLGWYAADSLQFEELEELPDAVAEMSGRHRIDMLVATSGAETLATPIPVCGTSPEKVAPFLDKLFLQHFFEDLDLPVPRIAAEGSYPAFLKPRTGAGGWRNILVSSEEERISWGREMEGIPYIAQELAEGIPASICCIADGTRARAISVNEQLLRGTPDAPYGFSGSITPFEPPKKVEMIQMAERACAASGCKGTIGVDFVVGDRTSVIEINPRFQATVDTVEMATGWNLFSRHVAACRGILPDTNAPLKRFAARGILFADRDRYIPADLSHLTPIVADIPWPGTYFEEGMAIVSVYGEGMSRAGAIGMLEKNISTVRQYMG
jgi:predicted ATP-grasp superfamily ATP-dependent carboligase